MENLLFDTPETKSPRLLWMERHGIHTHKTEGAVGMMGDWKAHTARVGESAADKGFEIAYGDTEDEAITQLALRLGIKLWNEEGGAA